MLTILLNHQWKDFLRSKGKNKIIATQIIMGFVLLYLISTACLLGIYLQQILEFFYGKANAINAFCGFVLLYFAIDACIRFQFQELPTLLLKPYLLQNVKRKQLINFLNISSLFTFFNLLPLLFFIPFVFTAISNKYGIGVMTSFCISIFALCWGNHFGLLYVKRKTINSGWWLLVFVANVLLIGTLNYYNILSIKKGSSFFFNVMINNPWLCTTTITYAFVAHQLNSRLLKNDFYFESYTNSTVKLLLQNNFLEWLASQNSVYEVEIKGIFRCKRTRTLMYVSIMFLGYGFVTFQPKFINNCQSVLPLIGAVMVIASTAVNYGQFIFAWQSSYFDGLMVNSLSIKEFIKSKFTILTIFATFNFFVSSFYAFINWHIIIILTSVFFFCIGVLPCIAIYLSLYHYKGIDVNESASFNYQGMSFITYLFAFSLFGIIGCIYAPFIFLNKPWWGISGIGIIGTINLLLRNWWIEFLTTRFYKKKYKLLEGFREN